MKSILVTGGAGYIGSHAVKALADAGYKVTIIDNLSKGHRSAVDKRAVFNEMDLKDGQALKDLFVREHFDGVLHFAGAIEVGLSMKEPAMFFESNVVNGVNLLEAMREGNTKNIIFSSTAAVYGEPVSIPIKETDPLKPTNFYGLSKLMFEQLLEKYRELYGMNYVALRYFNASGADPAGEIGQDYIPDTHLVPRLVKAVLGIYDKLSVFGTDYPTKDGTCIRDYIHVTDLVDAHLLALNFLFEKGQSEIFNLGNGNGFSVWEVIKTAEKVIEKKIPYEITLRRAGDPAVLVADSQKAKTLLNWNPKHSGLEEIIGTAWNWHSKHPQGYGD
jgi:UDP-glucose 4-epimerase